MNILAVARERLPKGSYAQFSGIAFTSAMIVTPLPSLYRAGEDIEAGMTIYLKPQNDGTYSIRRAVPPN